MGGLRGCRALLVEDEMLVAMMIEDTLAESGCDVVGPVARLEDAFAALEHTDINFAVLDVNLGGTFSYPIADRLVRRRVPFTFITGYGELDPAYARYPCLNKPFLPRDLEYHIAKIWRAAYG